MSYGDIESSLVVLNKGINKISEIILSNENIDEKLDELYKYYKERRDELKYTSLHATYHSLERICDIIKMEMTIQRYRIPFLIMDFSSTSSSSILSNYVKEISSWCAKNENLKSILTQEEIELLLSDWNNVYSYNYLLCDNKQVLTLLELCHRYCLSYFTQIFRGLDMKKYDDKFQKQRNLRNSKKVTDKLLDEIKKM